MNLQAEHARLSQHAHPTARLIRMSHSAEPVHVTSFDVRVKWAPSFGERCDLQRVFLPCVARSILRSTQPKMLHGRMIELLTGYWLCCRIPHFH